MALTRSYTHDYEKKRIVNIKKQMQRTKDLREKKESKVMILSLQKSEGALQRYIGLAKRFVRFSRRMVLVALSCL